VSKALGKKVKAPKKPKPKKIKPRQKAPAGRPKGPPGGIPPKAPSGTPDPVKEPPSPDKPVSRPKKGTFSPAELAKARKAAKKDIQAWPANWDTTAPGAPVSFPKDKTPEGRKRMVGPKGGKAKYRPAVSHSDMYKHVVRAIYVNGKARGYQFRENPAVSSQKIARAKMIKWGYAKRMSSKGGVADRRRIQLTGKGQSRSFRRHANEPIGVKRAKDLDYQAIVSRSPL
jgi:hypothetical protein